MLNRLILKVTKFQLPPPTRLGTVSKNILGGHHAPPCQIGLKTMEILKKVLLSVEYFLVFCMVNLSKIVRTKVNRMNHINQMK